MATNVLNKSTVSAYRLQASKKCKNTDTFVTRGMKAFWWISRIRILVISTCRKTSCTVSNSSGFSSVARALYTTGTYKLAMNGRNGVPSGE